jgi:lipopolysaccharide transport system permease protein
MIGAAFALSAITVLVRDLRDFVALFSAAGIFLMPVVYLPDMVPAMFRPVLYLNPFSHMTWVYQDVLYFGHMEHPIAWIVFPLVSLLVFAMGYRIFRRLKPQFSNVL